jgi:uncharacterized protein YqgC (DUF456 family)
MFLDVVLVILGFICLIAGLAGCILPVLPGPPLCYLSFILLQCTPYGQFSVRFFVITAILTIVVTVLDYIVPVWGTQKWGGSKAGMAGAVTGLIIGLFYAPVGFILGPFIGAVAAELIIGRRFQEALKSGFGSFIGFLAGTGLKLALCAVFCFYFVKELIV